MARRVWLNATVEPFFEMDSLEIMASKHIASNVSMECIEMDDAAN